LDRPLPADAFLIEQFEYYKVSTNGHFMFSSQSIADRYDVASKQINDAMKRIAELEEDGTAFNLSSNARMVLNEFVYDPNGTANSTLFSLTKGTFTFIASKVAKTGDMKIDTPVATMGIRGTTPHVEISADGTVRFANLIEENKAQVTEKVEQNKRGTPGKQHRAAQPSSGQRAESKTFDLNFKLCRGC
jgi:hypothetical protein